jgi:hypothetical protein
LQVLVFIFYFILVSYLISVIPFIKNAGIEKWKVIALFAIKVAAGIAYALFYRLPKYFENSDTWRFYNQSVKETDWLLKKPLAFCKDLFVYGYTKPGNLFSGENSYWNDLKSNVIIKIMALMNVITLKGYYSNIILFNFLFLFGLIALFKVFNKTFPNKKNLLIVSIFLLPSTLFWCSGIHKDGLILSATGLLVYLFYKGLRERFIIKEIIIMIVCISIIFALRNYVLFALLPALLCWYVSEKKCVKPITIFFLVYITGLIAFFLVPFIIPALNFPLFLSNKQNEFLQLQGTSAVAATELQPTLQSYLSYLPSALDMAFLRPHLTEVKNISYIPAMLENLLLLLIIALAVFLFNKKQSVRPVVLFFIFFAISVLMISGFTITFSGAIVRYKSFVLPLLITPAVCMIDANRVKTLLSFKRFGLK